MFKRQTGMPNPFRMNVKTVGLPSSPLKDLYHMVLSVTWFEFFAVNTVIYLSMNVFFAYLYTIGGNNIINADPGSFWDAFVFSFQTSTTIGYGEMHPANPYTDTIVIIDTLSGIIFVAITTGLAFSRFSRPTANVIYTDRCVIHQYEGKKTLFFRVANARDSHIADASISASVVLEQKSEEGLVMQRIHDLKLVRSKSPIFALSWTVMHVIDDESPLMTLNWEDLIEKHVRIVISLTGIDDWSSQVVHAAKMYRYDEIDYNMRFADVITNHPDGSVTMDYTQFNKMVPFQET
jgi:inward rectifier potassium channel